MRSMLRAAGCVLAALLVGTGVALADPPHPTGAPVITRGSGTGPLRFATEGCVSFAPGDALAFDAVESEFQSRSWPNWSVDHLRVAGETAAGGFTYELRADLRASEDLAHHEDHVGEGSVTVTRSDGVRLTGTLDVFVDIDFANGFAPFWHGVWRDGPTCK
jgi:hypothetical protein